MSKPSMAVSGGLRNRQVEPEVPTRPGLGLTLSEQVDTWARENTQVGTRP